MNYYKITQKVFINDEPAPYYYNDEGHCFYVFDDCRITLKHTSDSWDDIEKFYSLFFFGFSTYLKKCKKGYKLYVKGRKMLKSWKDDLHIEVTEKAEIATPSMQELLYCHDANKAIKYMAERGLQVLPHGKR